MSWLIFTRETGLRNMTKSRKPAATAAELAILEQLWERGPATIGDLRDSLYPNGGASKFATVQKLLGRLSEKHLVDRRKDGTRWVFEPLVERDAFLGDELRRVATRLGGESLTPVLTYLIETGALTADERNHLRRLLDQAAPASTRSKRKGGR